MSIKASNENKDRYINDQNNKHISTFKKTYQKGSTQSDEVLRFKYF